MAKPNYAFEKRQRELAKKKKKESKLEEKAQRKAAHAVHPGAGAPAPEAAASEEGAAPKADAES